MMFEARLDEALLSEVAWIKLPYPIMVLGQSVSRLDMRFEYYLPHMGQYNPFLARVPNSDEYIIWNGQDAWVTSMSETEAHRMVDHGKGQFETYAILPDDWPKHAVFIDISGRDLDISA